MSADDRAAAGPWWVTSFRWAGRRVTVKFKTTYDGYPRHVRLIEIAGAGPMVTPHALIRAMIATARAYCELHREDIAAAWGLARGAPSGVYAERETAP